MPKRLCVALLATAAVASASTVTAQEWSIRSGGTARVEYNDNYFLTSADAQSATTGSLTPFLTAARRTETSDIAAIVAIGANQVWGVSPNVDYVSGRIGLDGSLRDVRSTWAGSASYVRSTNLQNAAGVIGAPLVLAFTDAALVNGSYTYALTERWSLGANAGIYSNRYEGVNDTANLSNNHGYVVGGNAGYAYSERTQISLNTGYSRDLSNVTHSDQVTAVVGIVHQFSTELTASASAGGFWTDIESVQTPDALNGNRQRDTGGLYGGSLSYAFSERTRLSANITENLAPSGSGSVTKNESASASLTHNVTERLTGRIGANYTRTLFPQTVSTASYTNNNFTGEVGGTYALAEGWKIDAGYQYTRATYSQTAGEPRSNLIFVSIAYNWPGASFTDWIGRSPQSTGLPSAGAMQLSGQSALATPASSPSDATSTQNQPFDRFTIP